MNDDQLSDLQLRKFEEQLAAYPPQVSAGEKDRILYACAFDTGRNMASRSLRNWKVAAVGLSELLALAMIPHLSVGPDILQQALKNPVDSGPKPSLLKPLVADLDAWQVQARGVESLNEQLAEVSRFDPHLRSLTVSSLTRTVLNP